MVKSKIQNGRCSYMKTYGISTRYSTITIELSFYVLPYVYNAMSLLIVQKKMQKNMAAEQGYTKGVFLKIIGTSHLHLRNNF